MSPLNEKKDLEDLKITLEKNNLSKAQKANTLFLLCKFYAARDSILAKKYLTESSNYITDSLTKAKYNYYKGIYYNHMNKEKAAYFFKKSINEFSKFSSEEADCFQAEAWYNYASALWNKKGPSGAIELIIKKSIPLVQKHNNQIKTGYFYTLIGICLSLNAEFEKAEKYLLKGQKILENAAPNSTELLFNYLSTSNANCYVGHVKEAQINLERGRLLIYKYVDSSSYTEFVYSQTLVYITSMQDEKALSQTDIGIKLSEKFGQQRLRQFFIFQKIDILIHLKRYKDAKQNLLDLLNKKTIVNEAHVRRSTFENMVKVTELLGEYKEALQWSKKYSALSDSLNETKINSAMSLMEVRYRTSEKEKEIGKAQIEINNKNRYMWILGLGGLLILSSTVFLYLHYKSKQKLSLQEEINLKQKLVEQAQAEELKITRAIFDGEEHERERIAKDLHDGVAGLFAGVKLNLSNWASVNLQNNSKEGFLKIVKQLDYSLNELRRVSENMIPITLADHGLEEGLKDLCSFFTTEKIKIEFQAIDIDVNIPNSFQLNIYRIIQELIANAVKHSNADNIFVQCTYIHGIFLISVEDNGIGGINVFQKNYAGRGLVNIQKRINFMKGKIEIISKENEGTSINIELLVPHLYAG